MPVDYAGFTVLPTGFFDRLALDLPPSEPAGCHTVVAGAAAAARAVTANPPSIRTTRARGRRPPSRASWDALW